MYSINKYKVLEFPDEPTDYEDYEDILPYKILDNGDWKSLWLTRHPLCSMLKNRISNDEKLLWIELEHMKENIKVKKEALNKYLQSISNRYDELQETIAKNKKLCSGGGIQEHLENLEITLFCSLSESKTGLLTPFFAEIDDSVIMMCYITSFIEPKETCAEKLQKHLKKCEGFNGRYKCTEKFISLECQSKENGRCGHYYEIERAEEELQEFYYYENEENDEISEMTYTYNRAMAKKLNKLEEFYDEVYDDYHH